MFNRLKASFLMVGFAYLISYVGFVSSQSMDQGGGSTANVVSGGSGNAQTNAVDQSWSGTNTFNGITIFSGTSKVYSNTSSNFFSKLVVGTNAPISGYDFIADSRSKSGTYGLYGMFEGGNGQTYLYFGNDDAGGVEVFNNGAVTTVTPGNSANELRFMMPANGLFYIRNLGVNRLGSTPSGVSIGPNGAALTNIISSSITADPPSLLTLTGFSTNLAVTGARPGSPVVVGATTNSTGIMLDGYCPSNGVIWVDYYNVSGGSVDMAPHTLKVIQFVTEP